jgi:hypothetical protein
LATDLVNRDHPLPGVDRVAGDRGGRAGDAGVVDQHVEAAPPVDDGGAHLLRRVRVGDVHPHSQHAIGSVLAALLAGVLAAVAGSVPSPGRPGRGDVDVRDGDPEAVGEQPGRDGLAEAAGPAGDDRDPRVFGGHVLPQLS